MVATTLRRGEIAIIQYNSEDADNPHVVGTQNMDRDSISFILLADIGSGTQIFFTDRTWTPTAGSTVLNAGAFSSSGTDGTYTFTAATNMTKGTVITISTAELNLAGINLDSGGTAQNSASGEAIYVYQGTNASTPNNFLFALEIADGNNTFNASTVNTGLTSFDTVAIGADNASFGGRTWNQQTAVLYQNIDNANNWHSNENSPQANHVEGTNLFNAPDRQVWIAGISGGHGIMTVSADGSHGAGLLGYAIQHLYQNTSNDGNALTTTSRFWSPSDIVLDTANDKFFMVDSSGTFDRILQGSISQALANPAVAPAMTILYSEQPAVSDGSGITGIALDGANGHIYFTRNNDLMRVNYNTGNQAGTILADLGTDLDTNNPNFANEIALDLTRGFVYIVSTESFSEFINGPSGPVLAQVMYRNSIFRVANVSSADTGVGNNTVTKLVWSGVYDETNSAATATPQANEFEDAFGKLTSVDVNTATGELWFTTTQLNGGANGELGGIYKATIDAAGNATTTLVFQETNATNFNYQYIHVDEETGRYYVTSQEPGESGDHGLYTGSLSGVGAPTFVATVGNINDMTPKGLTVESAPTLAGTANGAAAVTEASSAPNSGETASVDIFNGLSAGDIDTPPGTDQLNGAQVRISNHFASSVAVLGAVPAAQDFLKIGGVTSGNLASGISFNYVQATGVMTFTGIATTAEYAAALDLVTFSTSGDNVTIYGTGGTRTISASVFDGLLYSDEIHATVSVTGINDAPVNTVGGAIGFSEDTTGSVGTAGPPPTAPVNAITGISVFDVDADPAVDDILVTLKVDVGTLFLRPDVVGGVTDITGNNTSEIILTGTQNQINATLSAMSPARAGPPVVPAAPNGLLYTPPANFNGSTNLTVTTNDVGSNGNDPGSSGTGTSEADIDVKVINVADVNDAPTVINGTTEAHPTILEDTPRTSDALTVAQLFGGHFSDALDVQVSGGNPTGSPGDTLAGIAITSATTSAIGKWQYHNGAVGDFSDATWLDISGGTMAAARTLTATTLIRFKPALDQNGTAPALTAHLVETGGIGLTNNGTINLTAGPDVPGTTSRVSTGAVTLTQEITPVNDAPIIANLTGDNQNHFEGDAARLLDIVPVAAVVTDVDSADFNGGSLTVTISGGDSAEDVIGVLDGNLITSDPIAVGGKVRYNGIEIGTYSSDGKNGAPLTIDFGTASKTAVQALIGRISYLNTDNDDPTTGARSFDFVLNDGDGNANGGDPTGSAIAIVNMQAVNDVTVVGGDTAARAFSEGVNGAASASLANDTMTLVDVDDDTLTNVKISIVTNYASAEDRLAFVNDNAATYGDIVGSFDIPTGVLTLTSPGGAASLAQFQAAVRAATYDNLSQEPSTATRTVRIVADDPPAGVSNNFEFTITVAANNDSPSGTTSTQTLVEDTIVQIKEGLLGYSDADGDAFSGVRLTAAPTGGKIYFDSGSGPVEVTLFDGSVTYSKTDLDAGKLTFVPTEHLAGTGAASFQFVVVDNGGVAGTGQNADVTPRTVTFDITPVNDEPQGSDNNSASVADDQIHTFTVANFQDNLVDVEGHLLSAVQLVALPSSADGIIYYDPDGAAPAAAINANDIFTIDDLMNGRLTFDPEATGSLKMVTLTFKAIDNGSPAATDQTPNTFTLNVAPGNTTPVLDLDADGAGTGFASAYTEGGAAAAISDTDVLITDADAGDQVEGATIAITNAVAGDVLTVVGALPGSITVDLVNSTATTLILTGTGTQAEYATAIEQITFANTGDNPTAGGTNTSRTINVTVTDGDVPSNIAVSTIAVADDNADAPSGTDSTISAIEDVFRLIDAADLGFSDTDGTFASVTISAVTGGAIYVDADGSAGAGDPVLATLPVTFTAQDLIDGKASFRAGPNVNGTGIGTITFAVTDDDGNIDASTNTLTVNVTAINDSPELTTGGPIAATEQTAVAILPAGAVADVDLDARNGGLGDYAGAQFSVNRNPATNAAEDRFSLVAGPNFTIDGSNLEAGGLIFGTINVDGSAGLIVITFTSLETEATSALVDEVIQAVRYTNISDNPPASVDLAVGFEDGSPGGGQGAGATDLDVNLVTVTIAGVNDAPVNSLGGTIDTGEDFVDAWLSGMSISDPDADPATDKMYITFQVAKGSLEFRFDVPNGIVAGDVFAQSANGDTFTILATLNQINATLAANNGLTYSPNANSNGDDTLKVYTNDQGANGSDPGLSGDGTSEEGYAERTISVEAKDDLAVAQDDDLSTPENATKTGSLFADNGFGPDSDVENDPFLITEITVGASTYAPGTVIDLPSGAKLTVNADGTYSYNPNGAFITLTDGSSGAVNTSKDDIFSYTVTGGDTATVTMTVTGVAGPGDWLEGDSGNNVITGTPQMDLFMLQQGGNDTVFGLASTDGFVFGSTLNSADSVDGGDGVDQIILQGHYSATPLTLGAGVVNVESIVLLAGDNTFFGDPGTSSYSYNITSVTQNVAPGQMLTVDAGQLRIGENFTFNGTAETDGGAFRLFGGLGIDTLTGGTQSDLFQFAEGRFGPSDTVNGGAGSALDQLALRGDYNITFGAAQLTSIESIVLLSGRDIKANTDYDYVLKIVDANHISGQLTVDAGQLKATESLNFDGSLETSGTLRLFGGKGNDTLRGGLLGDTITGAAGEDQLYGGGGGDVFVYRAITDSNSGGRDAIQDFAAGDLIDLSRIDANSNTGANEAFMFVGSNAFSNTAGELRVESQGGGIWLVQGDTDGIGGSDFEFFMVTGALTPSQGDFIL